MSDNSLAPSEDPGAALPEVSVATATAVERARVEIESQYTVAKRFPRDEYAAAARINQSMSRPGMAEKANFFYKRSGNPIEGPTIYLAREAKRCWGNIVSRNYVVERTDQETLIEAYALDMETNVVACLQTRMRNLVQRQVGKGDNKVTEWVAPDERDYLERVLSIGSRLERNCILSLLPPDVIDDARETAKKTVVAVARGEMTENRDATFRALLTAFTGYGIHRVDLENRLGHSLESSTDEEIAHLRQVFFSIDSEKVAATEFFPPAQTANQAAAASVKDRLEGAKKG